MNDTPHVVAIKSASDATWHAAHLAGICEERGRILDLLEHYAASEYQGGWIRRLVEAIEAGDVAPAGGPDRGQITRHEGG